MGHQEAAGALAFMHSLCGRAGHSVLTCALPGAALHRKLRSAAGSQQKQAGRKPRRRPCWCDVRIPCEAGQRLRQGPQVEGFGEVQRQEACLCEKVSQQGQLPPRQEFSFCGVAGSSCGRAASHAAASEAEEVFAVWHGRFGTVLLRERAAAGRLPLHSLQLQGSQECSGLLDGVSWLVCSGGPRCRLLLPQHGLAAASLSVHGLTLLGQRAQSTHRSVQGATGRGSFARTSFERTAEVGPTGEVCQTA